MSEKYNINIKVEMEDFIDNKDKLNSILEINKSLNNILKNLNADVKEININRVD